MQAVIDDAVIAKERKSLYLFAMMRLRDESLAEDAVQDTLVAAVQSKDRFEERSSLRTWLVAILRNKITDILRSRSKEVAIGDLVPEADEGDEVEEFFRSGDGHWDSAAVPQAWGQPEAAIEQTQFWNTFGRCLQGLPERTSEVFYLREVLGEDIEDICKNLGITQTNCSVMLFRARARLRLCLEENWFGADGGTR